MADLRKMLEDEERAFQESIAHLSAAEQQKKLWYWQLAKRQGIMEVEYLAEHK